MKKQLTIFLSALTLCSASAIASESLPADTNGDGKVSKDDATLIYDYILRKAPDKTTMNDVDVNRDGKVNTADVVEVYHKIINLGNVNVGDWTDGGTIDGGEVEEEIDE